MDCLVHPPRATVQEMHEQQVARIERLSNIGRPRAVQERLHLRILSCKDLQQGSAGDRLPDPFVVAQVTEVSGSAGSTSGTGG